MLKVNQGKRYDENSFILVLIYDVQTARLSFSATFDLDFFAADENKKIFKGLLLWFSAPLHRRHLQTPFIITVRNRTLPLSVGLTKSREALTSLRKKRLDGITCIHHERVLPLNRTVESRIGVLHALHGSVSENSIITQPSLNRTAHARCARCKH